MESSLVQRIYTHSLGEDVTYSHEERPPYGRIQSLANNRRREQFALEDPSDQSSPSSG
jgi:hypothetical protein